MEFCERMYNSTNTTMRELDSGVPNITRQQYLQMCKRARRAIPSDVNMFIIIPYVVIFLLSMAGNTLVILTLVRHKKMRTVTNMFLLNLAISDLLLALFCMPFTLVPLLMQEFIFGPVVCVLVRYAQAVSVGVSCATLVAISLERFYAICQPLKSRRWQTIKHSRKAIMGIWLSSASIMIPIAVFSKEMELNNGARACRELWPSGVWEPLYTVILDGVLLIVPLFLMAFSYGRISKDLWSEVSISTGSDLRSPLSEFDSTITGKDSQNGFSSPPNQSPRLSHRHVAPISPAEPASGKFQLRVIQSAHSCRLLANKKRVVKMLFVVVLEYFVCWTPLNLLNSWTVFDYESARDHFTPLSKTIILLLAYMSSCVHPITYCFMNKRFRQSFVDAFRCFFRKKTSTSTLYSEASHLNGVSAVHSTRSPPAYFRITWKRHT